MEGFYSLGKKLLLLLFLGVSLSQCKKRDREIPLKEPLETLVSGVTDILVEESVFPIVEDVNRVFESEYHKVKIELSKKPEAEILQSIFEGNTQIAVLARTLSEKELAFFEGVVKPKITYFASDAVVFVTNKDYKDSLIDYQQVLRKLQTKEEQEDLMLVFDNINSSAARKFKADAEIAEFPNQNVYFLNNTQEVIAYVAQSTEAVGVIGLNWLLQPSPELAESMAQIKLLAVKNPEDGNYYKPSQNNLAEATYPLIRKLYIIDLQGKAGLGTGFASYIAGPKGQRIILKSGLLPFKIPPREIIIIEEELK